MEGVKERQEEMEEGGGSGGDDGHLRPHSLVYCLLRAFLGCFGLLDSDPLFPNQYSPSQTHDPHDTPPVQEEDAFITTTEDVTLIQSLGVRMPRKPPPNPGRGGQTN